MARQVRRYRSRKRRDDRMGVIILLLAGVVMIGVLAGALLLGRAKLDDNGCPVGRHDAPKAKTVILVDQTDALPPAELRYIKSLIQNEYHWLPIDGVLAIRAINSSDVDAREAIVACRIADGSESWGLGDNPRALKQDFDRKVGKRLAVFLAGMDAAPAQTSSPILEEIAAIFAETDFGADIAERRLVIFSDMAQNSPAYTQYGAVNRRRYYLTPDAEESFAASMKDVAVRVHYVRRPKIAFQGARHIRFWKDYFRNMGVASVVVGHSLDEGEDATRKIWHE